MNVLILADFIVPRPIGGAGIAILNEALQIARLGFKVIIGTRLSSEGKFLEESLVTDYYSIKIRHVNDIQIKQLNNLHAIVLNNISLVEVASKLKKHFGVPILFRKHIDWINKIHISGKIGIRPKELFLAHKRHSPSKTIKLYQRALKISDLIADVDPSSLSIDEEKYCYLPPKPNHHFLEATLESWSIPGLSVLIGGRLKDPIKGSERIIRSLLKADEEGLSLDVHLLGRAPCHLVDKLNDRFNERFIDHGWVTSPNAQKHIFSKCNIFLTLPYYEPYGLMLEETIRNGLIPVSTATGLAKHIRSQNPELPILNSSEDESVITETVTKLKAIESLSIIELIKMRELLLSIPNTLESNIKSLSHHITNMAYEKEIPIFC
ncbi:MAG: glycosyltransferase [Marinifilaceae bacterium]|nr:glycosyltransferase [Marinifilaceae bacterium]